MVYHLYYKKCVFTTFMKCSNRFLKTCYVQEISFTHAVDIPLDIKFKQYEILICPMGASMALECGILNIVRCAVHTEKIFSISSEF